MSKQQEKLDQAARAAWLYYVAGKTQHEIAEQLQVSRQVAQRLVAAAVEQGLVKVTVTHPVAACLELAEALRRRFGLQLCEVVPADGDTPAELRKKLAVAGARVFERYLQQPRPLVAALGSGRTLKAVIDELGDIHSPQHRLVSLIGTIAHDGCSNRYDVALPAAQKTQSRYYLLPAPLYADSADDRAQWCHHRLYRAVEALGAEADVAFIGIGAIEPGCPLQEDGFLDQEEIAGLMARQAVAELLGRPMDSAGRLVGEAVQQRVTSLALRQRPDKPVIAFAGGEGKAAAILAALRGEWLSGLVTDEACARKMLEG
ncbi:sugar-binding transcriptional regulator [Chromobacterium rhizoryzae]|uniref:sugar-binding transcriptional regulator n=1 Tax=Chromobacterium rhizoryzae TaxID=1778675 RepID=UPI001D06FF82|nr:sugar-binding transcriptional regulator [Chromobacterium rhizoryzae]